jgi:acyl-CoA synthetase (AMP-forming)/AMP-acid ligase II
VIADIPDITAKRAALSPGAVALEEPETGRTLTYAELDRRAAGAACLMAQQGVAEGDRVAILCRNRIEFFETLFGCAKLGAILVPLNWRMPAAELSLLLADCEPKLLLFGKEEAELADRLGGSMQMLSLEACARAAGKAAARAFAQPGPASRSGTCSTRPEPRASPRASSTITGWRWPITSTSGRRSTSHRPTPPPASCRSSTRPGSTSTPSRR